MYISFNTYIKLINKYKAFIILIASSLTILQTRYDSDRGQYLFMTFVTLEPFGLAVGSSQVRDSQSRIDLYTQVTLSLLEILVTGIVLHSRVKGKCYKGRVSNLKITLYSRI